MSESIKEVSKPDVTAHDESESGSVYAASGSAEESIKLRTGLGHGEKGPRKRQRSTSADRSNSQTKRVRLKNARLNYRESYLNLFNETVFDLDRFRHGSKNELKPSTIGSSHWTSWEKYTFFTSLARRGRRDFRGISMDIGSKSEPQVFQYVSFLKRSLAEAPERMYDVGLSKDLFFDAAVEISPACTEALERHADSLAILQQHKEEKLEARSHGKLWKLKVKHGRQADRRMRPKRKDSADQDELEKNMPALFYLNLTRFLHMSKRMFMSSTDPEYDWRSYGEKAMSPSITYTALNDIYTLVRSVTRRVVCSAAFLFESRIRASYISGKAYEGKVSQKDVFAALDVLGMQRNAKKFWPRVPRRHKLEVFDDTQTTEDGISCTYEELEEMLDLEKSDLKSTPHSANQSTITTPLPIRASLEDTPIPEESPKRPEVDVNYTSDSEGFSSEATSANSDSTINSNPPSPDQADEYEAQAHSRMDLLDQHHRRIEERRLWELLGEPVPEHLQPSDSEDIKPQRHGNLGQQDTEWTDWVDYRAEWESFEAPVPAEAFAWMERRYREGKRERNRRSDAQSDSEGESDVSEDIDTDYDDHDDDNGEGEAGETKDNDSEVTDVSMGEDLEGGEAHIEGSRMSESIVESEGGSEAEGGSGSEEEL